ncbi:cytochrome P450 716B2-like [Pyrus ussuriensis x Pyrus communis]|uniref:Cytochrome P450 716B2-like n=1 Tax=Pyrus ussuriensis x Pyrus communis TaxID=2448454 RepID=A0A5N5H9Z7_9ROSA|nr:cytochrome P450 716B2-like [Pyrus ussuriensis x Pyrus communis]
MLEAANTMRKEVLLLIKEKKAAASRGVQMHDILSFILFNPDPTGRCIGRQAAPTKSPNTFLIRKSTNSRTSTEWDALILCIASL